MDGPEIIDGDAHGRAAGILGPDGETPARLFMQQRDALDDASTQFKTGTETGRIARVTSADAYETVEAIYTAVTTIAGAIAKLPRELVRVNDEDDDGDDEVITRHPILDRIGRPRPRKSGYDLIYGTVVQLEMSGVGLWWTRGSERGEFTGRKIVARIDLLPTPMVKPVRDRAGGEIIAYRYWQAGALTPTMIPAEEIVQFSYYNPRDPEWGLGTFSAAAGAANTDRKAGAVAEAFFDNNAQPGGLLIYKKGRLGPMQANQAERQFQDRYGGPKNAGKTSVLSGDWDYKQLMFTQKDMELIEQRRDLARRVGQVFKVPGILMNDPNQSNYATAHVEERIFAEYNWLPKANQLAETITEALVEAVAPGEGLRFRFNASEAPGVRQNLSEQADTAKKWWDMGVPLNEAKKLAKAAIPDVPWGDTWYKPFNLEDVQASHLEEPELPPSLQPGGGEPAEEEPEPDEDVELEDTDAEDAETDAEEDDEDGGERSGRGAPAFCRDIRTAKQRRVGLIEDATREAYWRSYVQRLAPMIGKMQSRVKRHLYELRQEMLDNLAQLAEAGAFGRSATGGLTRVTFTRASSDELLHAILFDRDSADRKLREAAGPLLREAMEKGGDQAYAELGLEEGFMLEGSDLGLRAFERRSNLIVGVDETLFNHISATLKDGLANGESASEMAARISAELNHASQRARTIARTEVGTAVQTGRQTAMQEQGVEQHEWLSSRDEVVRGNGPKDKYDHRIDGEVVKVGAEFSVGLKFPLDDEGSESDAGNVINCRCTTIPSID
jgi:HK97 family phage portal protein